MKELENEERVSGYNLEIFVEENNFNYLKKTAKNQHLTVDLLLEQVIEKTITDLKNQKN